MKLTPQFTVHIQNAPPLLKCKDCALDHAVDLNRGHINYNRLVLEFKQEGVCLLASGKGGFQNLWVQCRKNLNNWFA